MVSSWGGMSPPKDLSMVKPIERVLRSGLFGPWDRPTCGSTSCPPGLNPARAPGVGRRLVPVLPELHAAGLGAGLVPHVPLLADVVQHATSSRARSTSCRRSTADERLAQELAAVTFKEYALQDGNTLEATQTMIESRVVTEFPLCDQEILLRHLHTHRPRLRRPTHQRASRGARSQISAAS